MPLSELESHLRFNKGIEDAQAFTPLPTMEKLEDVVLIGSQHLVPVRLSLDSATSAMIRAVTSTDHLLMEGRAFEASGALQRMDSHFKS